MHEMLILDIYLKFVFNKLEFLFFLALYISIWKHNFPVNLFVTLDVGLMLIDPLKLSLFLD